MGKMNFLQGGYTGTLGETYGVKQRRTVFAKAKPFSHTPHNQIQKNSFTAFGCLQRFSALLNKTFWQYTGLSDKGRNRMNVTAEFFKPMVSDHLFNFNKVFDVVPQKEELEVQGFAFNEETQTFGVTINVYSTIEEDPEARLFIGVYAPDGKPLAALNTHADGATYNLPTVFTNKTNAYAVAILSTVEGGKRGMVASSYKSLRSDIVVGQCWFPNNMHNGVWGYTDPGRLTAIGAVTDVQGERLICNGL